MKRSKRILALLLVAVLALGLCGCRRKKNKEEAAENVIAVVTPMPNEPFEVKLDMENLYDYFYYKEYRSDTKGDDGKILSSQISYGLQLNEAFTAANDPELKDTMKIRFKATGLLMAGEFQVDFDTLKFTGSATEFERNEISEELVFWPKGDRTTTWAYGNYSPSYILFFENFEVTDVSGSVWLKRAEPKQ